MLDVYAAATRQALTRYLPGDVSADYLLAPAAEYLKRGGKGLRPALCLATCEAFGGDADNALPSAAALELLHTAFLIHDDIEDHSGLRRGETALHHRYGTELAINAGDGLAIFALGALRDNRERLGGRLAERIWSEFEFMARQTVDGQAIELGWRIDNRTDLAPGDYLDLIMKKTCWYTTVLPLRIGALVGSRGSADPESMIPFGFLLGASFQIQDDILNLVGKPDRYGKEPMGDLREGKRTLMLIHLLAAASPADRKRLEAYLSSSRETRSERDVEKVFEKMERYGSVAFAREFARGIARSADAAFEVAFAGVPDSPARRFLRTMIPYMVERDR
jgi:geranylgeranyl diphosphate synthase type II